MEIALQILMLVAGFVFLIKGADVLVSGASSIAANFKVSKMLIGLTIVAFGTSAPELAVSISALANGTTDMLLGNVIGSNIMNILLLVGIGALICPIVVKRNTVSKE
ncbi:sodium:calcium antiporter, partial [Ralstonia pseudosolanacearum]|uniref:sodium:calcium antiporter n=1 Tax=Ralstonia pseudosolanacearum TaxID=1310165 RepID=UPI003D162F35